MKTVTTWNVKVEVLDDYSGRSMGNKTVSVGIATEEEAKKVAAAWDHRDMVHGKATIVTVTKEVPERECNDHTSNTMLDIAHIITFTPSGKDIMEWAMSCVVGNAHDDKHPYVNYVKVCGKMDTETLIGIAKLVADEIHASGTIHLTETNKLVMLCGLNIYGNKMIDCRRDAFGNEQESRRLNGIISNILDAIAKIAAIQV